MTRAVVFADGEVEHYEDLASAKAATGTTWVRASGTTVESFQAVADVFDIHHLAVEDVLNNARSRLEEFDHYTFVLVKSAELAPGNGAFREEIREEPIGLFVGNDWLVTFSTGRAPPVDRVWTAVENRDKRLLQHGPDFVAYRLIDVAVDEYFGLLERIEEQIEVVEEDVLVSTDIETLENINRVRRDLLSFRKLAWPTREVVSVLARGDPEQVNQRTEKYFRDVYDHLVQVVDLIETYRDLTTGARDIYLNTLSQSTNEVMKTLTVVATIFLPLTFVVGIYGMNFAGSRYNMPELTWTYGYPAVMVGMGAVSAAMLWYFKQMDYL